METLNYLAGQYGTDKNNHGFIDEYASLFEKFREENFNFLEIGVFMGASIKMWNDYFTNAKIYGLDCFDGRQGNGTTFDGFLNFYNEWLESKDSKINLVRCDQSKEEELESFKKHCKENNIKFKVIIDDGSHLMRDQQITFAHFFELVEDGGYYIIEDSHTSDDRVGYDVLEDFSNSTKKIFSEYQETKKIESIYINDAPVLDTISSQINSVYNFKSTNNVSQTLIITKK